jgi:hypothetical protein
LSLEELAIVLVASPLTLVAVEVEKLYRRWRASPVTATEA